MIFKHTERMKAEFWELDPKLRLMLCDVECWMKRYGEDLYVTCLFRTAEEQKELFEAELSKFRPGTSVHEFGRAADIRPPKNEDLCRMLELWLSQSYPYDPARPRLNSIVDERRGHGTGAHYHLQVMPLMPIQQGGLHV